MIREETDITGMLRELGFDTRVKTRARLSIKISSALCEWVHWTAEREGILVSDVVRNALAATVKVRHEQATMQKYAQDIHDLKAELQEIKQKIAKSEATAVDNADLSQV